ncbi:MAG: nucleotidyltransferase family protein, partial [Acidimicrobiia bacterium]
MAAPAIVEQRGDVALATTRLLWEACRPVPRPECVCAVVDAGADVALAAHLALPQHAGPLLWRALAAADRLVALGAARSPLHTEYEVRRAQAALLLPVALATAIEPLTTAGLEPLVLKGPTVAARYPEPGLRPMDDLDLLLPTEQHDAGIAALTGAGWTVWRGDARHDYDTVLQHPLVPDFPLELHHELESRHERADRLTARDLWRRRTPRRLFGIAAFGLDVEDEIVALASHAAKPFHHFQRLIWSVDIAVVVAAAGSTIDWARVATRARAARCATAVAVMLRHARRLGAAVPADLVELSGGRLRRAALAPVLDVTWPLVSADVGLGHRLRYAVPDSRLRRARLVLGEVAAEGSRRVPRRSVRLLGQLVRRAGPLRRLAPS